jgi:XTP/dITP diphosphohydrolase
MKLIFATSNIHKVEEVERKLREINSNIEILTLDDVAFYGEIEETGKTLDENALIKAKTLWDKFHLPCFADDTGLEIDALNGEPGVFSARYFSINDDIWTFPTDIINISKEEIYEINVLKVLKKMDKQDNRKAKFRTVIAYINDEGNEFLFEGRVDGEILTEKHGTDGFGYDPIFLPDGYNLSFAEMPLEQKNKISHRAKSLEKFVEKLKELRS